MEEVKFWEKAVRLLEKEYGKPCKHPDMSCAGCRGHIAISVLEEVIDVKEWAAQRLGERRKKRTKKLSK